MLHWFDQEIGGLIGGRIWGQNTVKKVNIAVAPGKLTGALRRYLVESHFNAAPTGETVRLRTERCRSLHWVYA